MKANQGHAPAQSVKNEHLAQLAICELLFWDIPTGLAVKSMRDPVMMGHHIGMLMAAYIGTQVTWSYYAIFFFGTCEVSGIFLSIVDVFHPKHKEWAALSEYVMLPHLVQFRSLPHLVEQLRSVLHDPARMAGRILDMGDVVALVEKAAETIEAEEAERLAKRMAKGQFDMNDFLTQLRQLQKITGSSGFGCPISPPRSAHRSTSRRPGRSSGSRGRPTTSSATRLAPLALASRCTSPMPSSAARRRRRLAPRASAADRASLLSSKRRSSEPKARRGG